MLEPRKEKYRKQFRGRMKGKSVRGSTLNFGDYGLKSLGRGWLTTRQIEAARKAITHQTKRQGKVWIRVFPDKPVTKKPAGVRMGSGKGAVDHHVAVVTPGRIIFELAGVDEAIASEAIKRAGAKIPFKTKFVKKE
ncbi:50S ribosomal protein L16 [Patescibacteria group bacterium]|nr:50S ribosomal protein L16 [Patescibacteria group bacterium]